MEFASSSVLFRLVRPYATFTAWHWQLTAMLIGAYLLAGIVFGGLAGLLVSVLRTRTSWLDNGDSAVTLEGAATLTLLAAFAINLLVFPHWPSGKLALLAMCVGLGVAVLAGMRSAQWSERLGLLASPWVVSALLLGVGQGAGFMQLQDLGRELGARNWLWLGLLAVALTVLIAGAIVIGRWVRPRMLRDRYTMFAPSWAALGLAVILVVGSFWLAGKSTAQTSVSATLPGSSGQPNVLFVVMDTVRADHLSLYGYGLDTTPNLKKLAVDSTVYTRAISPADMTLTSHASMFTGLYPSWHGAYCQPPDAAHGRVLNANVPTLAEIYLRKATPRWVWPRTFICGRILVCRGVFRVSKYPGRFRCLGRMRVGIFFGSE